MADYLDTADLYTTFGKNNTRKWADLDGQDDSSDTDANILAALNYGEAYVLDRMRGGAYSFPLVTLSSTALVTIKHAMAQIAGWKLYIARGFRDNEIIENRMQGHKEDAEAFLEKVVSGQITLDLSRTEDPNSPVVVE